MFSLSLNLNWNTFELEHLIICLSVFIKSAYICTVPAFHHYSSPWWPRSAKPLLKYIGLFYFEVGDKTQNIWFQSLSYEHQLLYTACALVIVILFSSLWRSTSLNFAISTLASCVSLLMYSCTTKLLHTCYWKKEKSRKDEKVNWSHCSKEHSTHSTLAHVAFILKCF